MATGKCGTAVVEYDEAKCSYACSCPKGGGCSWSVTCGAIVVSGTGIVNPPPHKHLYPVTTVSGGNLAMCGKNLEGLWNRPVVVPPELREQRVRKRTIKGLPEEVAKALGFELGPKRKGRSAK